MSDTTFHQGEHTAAKPYRCDHCQMEITKGARYYKQTGIWEGDFFTFRAHADCETLARKIHEAAGLGWDEGILLCDEYLAEPEDTAKWFKEFPEVGTRLAGSSVDATEPECP